MRKLIVLHLCAILVAVLMAPGVSSARADDVCAVPIFSLTDWEESWADHVMYVGVEGQSTPFVIARGGHDCTPTPSDVSYSVSAGTAQESEFNAPDGPVRIVGAGTDEVVTQPVRVNLPEDNLTEGVEHAIVRLHGTTYGRMGSPTTANLYILDDDDPQERIAFIPQQFSRNEFFNSVRIPVFRWGNVSLPTTVNYTVTGGPGEPASPGTEISEGGVAQFEAGRYWTWITIPLFDDSAAEPSEHATITLSGPSVSTPDSAVLTIVDNEETRPPTSRFHHPKNKFAYVYKDYRIREVHVFTDDVGSGVLRAEWALRKKMRSGKCKWWGGGKWAGGSCSSKKWLRMKKRYPDFFFATIRPLSPSVRSRIKNYTAFSKALDRAGNWEKRTVIGRNANTFEVKRKR